MKTGSIITIPQFLSPSESESWLNFIESFGFDVQYSGDGRQIRSRAQFENTEWAKLIWGRLKTKLPKLETIYSHCLKPEPLTDHQLETYFPVGLNERFRCYKYGPDEEFQRHQDFAHEYSNLKRTFLTVLIYLNDNFSGGETRFKNHQIAPQLGMLAMFPHELEHAGCKITSGFKYSLRTDVVYESKSVN